MFISVHPFNPHLDEPTEVWVNANNIRKFYTNYNELSKEHYTALDLDYGSMAVTETPNEIMVKIHDTKL